MKRAAFLLILAVCAWALCACVTNGQIQHYNAGVAAYEANDLVSAKHEFLQAGGYGNSRSYLSAIAEYESIYLSAVESFDAGDYDEARRVFASIPEYGNSSEFVAYIDRIAELYAEGEAAFEEEDYVTARDRFYRASGYADSSDRVSQIDRFEDNYRIAMGFYSEGNYLESLEAFRKIGVSYRDTDEKIASILELFRSFGIKPAELLTIFAENCAAEEPPITLASSSIGDGAFTAYASNGLMIVGNSDDAGYITNVSFWIEPGLRKALGDDGMDRMLGLCIVSMAPGGDDIDTVLGKLGSFLDGSLDSGVFCITYSRDRSGASVLTGTRR
ncbi:MAG: hypothetical protein II756_04080 [Clostridia bacterium]|nr:hypothetical protein [Clostridia bacterium]